MDARSTHEACSIFVDNLTEDVSLGILWKKFRPCGDVIHIRIARKTRTERDRRFAFVEFRSISDARFAINTLDGSFLQGKRITVQHARPRRTKSPSASFASPSENLHRKQGNDHKKANCPVTNPTPSVSLSRSEIMDDRLRRSLIIESSIPAQLETLKSKISRITRVENFTPLSPNKLLVFLPSIEDRDRLLSSKPHWCLKPWTIEELPNSRRACVIVRGIPIPAWCRSTFQSVAQLFGTLIDFREVQLSASSPEIQMVIETKKMTTICEEVKARFDDGVIRLGISELIQLPSESISHNFQLSTQQTSPANSRPPFVQNPSRQTPESPGTESHHHRSLPQTVSNCNVSNNYPSPEDSQEALHCLGINLLLNAFGVDESLGKHVEMTQAYILDNKPELIADPHGGAINLQATPVMPPLSHNEVINLRFGSVPSPENTLVNQANMGHLDPSTQPFPSSPGTLNGPHPAPHSLSNLETDNPILINNIQQTSPLLDLSSSPIVSYVADSEEGDTRRSEDSSVSADLAQFADMSNQISQNTGLLPLPTMIHSSLQPYFNIGAQIIGKDITDKIPCKEAVATLGMGSFLNCHIPNPLISIQNYSDTFESMRRSARIAEKGNKTVNKCDDEDSTATSKSLEF